MDWSRHRNPVLNFVNLGRLYSLSQSKKLRSDTKFPVLEPPCEVGNLYAGLNLGNLYRRTNHGDYLQPRGWAYFEDGSVFFPRWGYDHHELQHVMKIAACFVRNPSNEQRTLEKNDRQEKMVLLERHFPDAILGPGHLHLYARYSYDGENMCDPSTPYTTVSLKLDPTGTSPITTTLHTVGRRRLGLPTFKFLSIADTIASSHTFRGTLIDGVLQPNVRLGTGLKFLSDRPAKKKLTPHPEATQEQQTVTSTSNSKHQQQTSRQRKEQQQEGSSQHSSTAANESSGAQQDEQERELRRQEDASHWKQKAWQLEEELAETRCRLEGRVLKLEKMLAEANAKLQSAHHGKDADRRLLAAQQADDIPELNTSPPPSPAGIRKSKDGPKGHQPQSRRVFNTFVETEAMEREKEEREAISQAESIHEILNRDDIMPTKALNLLRKASPKR